MPAHPQRPSHHRHSDSSPAIVFPQSPEDSPKPPFNSRIITSVRRNFSTTRRRDPTPAAGPMYSTQAERNPYTPARFRYDPPTARPTVEQIAMGLHLSRTPHLRGAPKYPAPASHPQPSHKPIPLPPPPARSSLKKPGIPPPPAFVHGGSTSSTTDVTSTTPSTPHSSDRSSASLRTRMARFLPVRGLHPASASTPSSSAVSSPRTSTSELAAHPPRGKKAVRFSSTVEEED
ncbi:hypothetical protein B0H16DRAFT_1532281 [Mycena metata]|uniref:Uncharacterized protein n=1 Tax=Mycena metata TaxID=1033252 RepID=A0AAD7JA86_9AGAR|nr:hypothetical protein B0H16DRAFT_1532281 [Mycena metata]